MASPLRYEGSNEDFQHLTWVTRERERVFANSQLADVCLAAFDSERVRLRISVFAYVLMPDHVHMVVGPSIMPTGNVVQWMKLASSYWIKREGLLERSPWAPRFWDRAIRTEAQLRRAIEYLHANPVRAGLVEVGEEYEYSSCSSSGSILRITPPPLT